MSAGMKLAAVRRGDIVVAILVCVPCRESRAAVCRRGRGSLCPCHRLKAVWKRWEDAGKSSVNHAECRGDDVHDGVLALLEAYARRGRRSSRHE